MKAAWTLEGRVSLGHHARTWDSQTVEPAELFEPIEPSARIERIELVGLAVHNDPIEPIELIELTELIALIEHDERIEPD